MKVVDHQCSDVDVKYDHPRFFFSRVYLMLESNGETYRVKNLAVVILFACAVSNELFGLSDWIFQFFVRNFDSNAIGLYSSLDSNFLFWLFFN